MKLLRNRRLLKIGSRSRNLRPRFFGGASVYYVAVFFWEGITEGDVGTRAASISYRILMALFPTIIFGLSLIPYIPIENLDVIILDNLHNVMPVSAHDLLSSLVTDLTARKQSTLLSLGFLLGLYYATNTINAHRQKWDLGETTQRLSKKHAQICWVAQRLYVTFWFFWNSL